MQSQRSLAHLSRKLIHPGDFGVMLAAQRFSNYSGLWTDLRLTATICGYIEKVGRQLWPSSFLHCGWVPNSLCDCCDHPESAKMVAHDELIELVSQSDWTIHWIFRSWSNPILWLFLLYLLVPYQSALAESEPCDCISGWCTNNCCRILVPLSIIVL